MNRIMLLQIFKDEKEVHLQSIEAIYVLYSSVKELKDYLLEEDKNTNNSETNCR